MASGVHESCVSDVRRDRRGPRITSDIRLVPPRSDDVAGVKDSETAARSVGDTVGDCDSIRQSAAGSGKRNKKVRSKRLQQQMPLPSGAGVDVVPGGKYRPAAAAASEDRTYASATGSGTRGTAENTVVRDEHYSAGPSRPVTRRAPRTAVVSIKQGIDGPNYAELFRSARERVDLAEIGITESRIRWAANGSILIEVPGFDKSKKADLLALKLKEALAGEANVTRPVINGEMRIWGLDDSISADEVICTIAETGGCLPDEVRSGPVVKMPNGLGVIWVRCPLATAIKVSANNKFGIGWTIVRVELMRARPMQCWQFGHTSNKCKTDVDRSRACFRCGQEGYIARNCSAVPKCLICERTGIPANHRMGSQGLRQLLLGHAWSHRVGQCGGGGNL